MPAKNPWLLCRSVALALGFFAACSGNDEATGNPDADVTGASGMHAGTSPGGSSPEGGEPELQGGGNHGGTPPLVLGGIGGTPQGDAGDAGDAGTPAEPGGNAGIGGSSEPDSTIEQLTLCARLTAKFTRAGRIALAFDASVYKDACVGWVTTLYEMEDQGRSKFLNNLQAWSLRFWGCDEEAGGVDDFALIYKPTPLSAGDATLLIAYYIAVAKAELNLSPSEIDDMRAALQRLSKTVVNDPSELPSHQECLDEPGGAGGAAGAGGNASAAGQAPEIAGQGGSL